MATYNIAALNEWFTEQNKKGIEICTRLKLPSKSADLCDIADTLVQRFLMKADRKITFCPSDFENGTLMPYQARDILKIDFNDSDKLWNPDCSEPLSSRYIDTTIASLVIIVASAIINKEKVNIRISNWDTDLSDKRTTQIINAFTKIVNVALSKEETRKKFKDFIDNAEVIYRVKGY